MGFIGFRMYIKLLSSGAVVCMWGFSLVSIGLSGFSLSPSRLKIIV